MTYVDGFVAAVPTENREAYRKHAEIASAVFKAHGALSVVECWGVQALVENSNGSLRRRPGPSLKGGSSRSPQSRPRR